ncbi:MAG: hypothetical protein KAV87_25945 [Desulfobacteraceae bacterium]|nr:hypothetical protein [Desulfobacteraceae bacterium]
MKTKFLISVSCLLLLSSLTVPATACCKPPAPPCHHCEDTVWVYDCNSADCEECVDGNCVVIDVNFVTPDANYVCVGCDVTFTVETDPCGYGDDVEWSAPGGDPNSDTGSSFTTSWDTAGIHTATASLCDSNDSNDVTVVAVASLEPNEPNDPNAITEIDDDDGDPNTRSFIVCIVDPNHDPNVITVIATPDPDVNEPNLPACWSLSGSGTSKLERAVDKTTVGATTITCTCNTSSKTTTIYVVQVDVNAGLSEPNELDPGKYINVNWDDDDDDGWEPDDTPPYGVYTGDKDDPNIEGGDTDFRSFTISISPSSIKTDLPDTHVSVTFGGNVKVWETTTKLDANGVSSEVSSGALFAITDLTKTLYLEGVSGSSDFNDVELKATYLPCDANDIIKVTVFEVDLDGKFGFGPQQGDNERRHRFFQGSSDKNGKISWDDANADGVKDDNDPNCEYFRNCMECQGTVKPSGVTTEVEFDFDRKCWVRMWYSSNGIDWELELDKTPWQPDDGGDVDEDQSPSPLNHIYQIDGPGLTWRVRPPNYVVHVGDFKEWVMVKIDGSWYQCSDYYKWYSKVRTQPKGSTWYITRVHIYLQLLGSSWIPISP